MPFIHSNTKFCSDESVPRGQHEKGEFPRACDQCLAYLNWVRLMVKPIEGITTQANQQAAIGSTLKYVADMNVQEVFVYMKMMEAVAAQVFIIHEDRTRKERIPNPKELQQQNEDWQRAVKEQKDRLKSTPELKKEKKILSDRDRAVEALVSVGVPRKAAEESVDEKMRQQGKVVA